ncbi:hypothetical protein F4780DRAFT_419005 [Xylariomycetidae sp. FL0641]|nr:hypothetical protein F4780DRAFT_419005 [Xylariomycetidae sp. FL0641]
MSSKATVVSLSGHSRIQVRQDALDAMKTLAADDGKQSAVLLSIDAETEVIELAPGDAQPQSISELAEVIPANEPRFTFWRHTAEEDSHVLFFLTCPEASGMEALKARMMYPLMRRAVLNIARDECGLTVDGKFELQDPVHINESLIRPELERLREVRTPAAA